MKRKRVRTLWLIGTAWIFFLSACGLPGELKKEARQKTEQIAAARNVVSKRKAKYLDFKASDRFKFFEVYAKRENWEAHFQEAEKQLNQAEKEVTQGRVAFLLNVNDRKKAGTLRVELVKIDRMIRRAMQISGKPWERMKQLERIRENAPQLVNTAEKSLETIHRIIDSLEKSFIPKARGDYPKRAEDIMKRFAPLKKLQEDADAALMAAKVQLNLHEAGQNADYAVLGAKTDQVNANLDTLKKRDKEYRAKINELYQSYTKILDDMKIDYYVTVGRVSWDEDSDYWREHNYIYPPRKVNRKVYEYFAKLNPKMVPATYSTSWGGRYKIYVLDHYWKALKINPARNWPARADDHAEFWIEDAFPKAFHKYTLVQNGKRRKTGWILIDEEDYYDYYNDLGMEIVSKPYGYFEEERVKEPSPPGMAFVGNSRYGEWRTDHSTGRSFWYYYGIYSFLNRGPGYRYYRDDWNRWRGKYRNRKPYYGGTGAGGATWGTYGTYVRTDGRYRNTDFAKKGGLKTQAASVRGAGPARRGGGPGGRGK